MSNDQFEIDGGLQLNGELQSHHVWTRIETVITAADLWTYLLREFVMPDPYRNPPDDGDVFTDTRAIVSEYLIPFDELAYVTDWNDPNPHYDPNAPKNPANPLYDKDKTHEYMEYSASGLQIGGAYPRRTLGVKLRQGYTPSYGWVDYSGLEVTYGDGLGSGLNVRLLRTVLDDGMEVDYSGMTIMPRWGLTICPANNSLVILPGVWYDDPDEPRGGISVKLAEESGLQITEQGLGICKASPANPNGKGLAYGWREDGVPTVQVGMHVKDLGIKKVKVPNPNYSPDDGDFYDGVAPDDLMDVIPDRIKSKLNKTREVLGLKNTYDDVVTPKVKEAWSKLALRAKGILPKGDDDDEPFMEVEGHAYDYSCLSVDDNGMFMVLNDPFLTLDTTTHDWDTFAPISQRHCVLKARRWRDHLIVTALQIFNVIIEIIQTIINLMGSAIELPKIPDDIIDAWPVVSDWLEFVFDGGQCPLFTS